MESTLEYVVYGKPAADASGYSVFTRTTRLAEEDALRYRQYIPLDPLPAETEGASRAVALVTVPLRGGGSEYVLARAACQNGNPLLPVFIFVPLPLAMIEIAGGDLQPLMRLIYMVPTSGVSPAKPLPMPSSITWSHEKRVSNLKQAYELTQHNIEPLVQLIGAALDDRRLLIQNFPGDAEQRLVLVQALMMMLPAPMRAQVTFTAHSLSIPEGEPFVVFSEATSPTDRWRFDWHTAAMHEPLPDTPYMSYLRGLWHDNISKLAESLRNADMLAMQVMPGLSIEEGLSMLMTRHRLDQAIENDEPVGVEDLLAVLTGSAPPQGEQRLHYLERLLMTSLDQRNTDAADFIAQAMDTDPELDMQLSVIFNQALESQPDAVYVFVRRRLAASFDERWLARLHTAAERSLSVAIEQGDTTTVSEWLRLIAREPARYKLGDVLHEGLLQARSRAAEDSTLAVELLTQAVKRDAAALPVLLADPELIKALPEDVHQAVIGHNREAIEALAGHFRELFLLALVQAAGAKNLCISAHIIKTLWDLYENPGNIVLTEPYMPVNVMRTLLAGNPECMEDGALETLLTLVLAAKEDNLFREIVPPATPAVFGEGLVNALEQSGRSMSDGLMLAGYLVTDGRLSHQAHVDILEALFLNTGSENDRELVAEHLARLLSQHADVSAATAVLWKMLDLAAETRSDLIVKVAAKRLLGEFNDLATDTGLTESLIRMRKATAWSQLARTIVLTWWRSFVRSQPIAQLQKLDKLLEAKRGTGLDDMRHVLETALALRRIIGQKSLEEFASDISTAYRVLQLLADGFDPDPRQAAGIDITTLRSVIGAKVEELSPDVRHVLATNLKELAQVITSLAENRSKPNLLSRDESVDRALMSGEQQPESALDVMKFLSGFLDGAQQKNET